MSKTLLIVNESAFDKSQKVALALFGVTLLLPVEVRYLYLHDIALLVVLYTFRADNYVSKLTPVYTVLLFPLLVWLLPGSHTGSFNVVKALTVWVKMSISLSFFYCMFVRCRNEQNSTWFLSRIVLPVSCIIGLAFITDYYTNNDWFVKWQEISGIRTPDRQRLEALSIDDFDVLLRKGIMGRWSDNLEWALLSIVVTLWLVKRQKLAKPLAAAICAVGATVMLITPLRSGIVLLICYLSALLLVSVWKKREWRARLILLSGAVVIAASLFSGVLVELPTMIAANVSGGGDRASGLSRVFVKGLQDSRSELIQMQLEQWLKTPLDVLLGHGWDFSAGAWPKAHNTIIGFLIGGGLIVLLPLVVWFWKLIKSIPHNHGDNTGKELGSALFLSIFINININGQFYGMLEYPFFLLVIFITVASIIYQGSFSRSPYFMKAS